MDQPTAEQEIVAKWTVSGSDGPAVSFVNWTRDLVVQGAEERELLRIDQDGTVTGEITDAGPAAEVFCEAVADRMIGIATPERAAILALIDREAGPGPNALTQIADAIRRGEHLTRKDG